MILLLAFSRARYARATNANTAMESFAFSAYILVLFLVAADAGYYVYVSYIAFDILFFFILSAIIFAFHLLLTYLRF